jgi:hypothetical protein
MMQAPEEVVRMIQLTGGVQVTYGSAMTWGHRESETVYVGEGPQVAGTDDVVHVVRGTLGALKRDSAIVVDGETREIGDLMDTAEEDAVYTAITLRARDPRNRAHRRP